MRGRAAAPKGTKSCRTQGTFVCSFVSPSIRPLRGQILGLGGPGGDERTDGRTNEQKSPVFYRTSSPSGPLPCLSFQFTTMQSRATGIADHILPLGDLLYFIDGLIKKSKILQPDAARCGEENQMEGGGNKINRSPKGITGQ